MRFSGALKAIAHVWKEETTGHFNTTNQFQNSDRPTENNIHLLHLFMHIDYNLYPFLPHISIYSLTLYQVSYLSYGFYALQKPTFFLRRGKEQRWRRSSCFSLHPPLSQIVEPQSGERRRAEAAPPPQDHAQSQECLPCYHGAAA